jgi:hypothetical protein
MGGQTGILTRENAALIGHKLPEQIRVFEIERVDRKIDFWLGTRSADFSEGRTAAGATFFGFVRASFSGHRLFDFAMQGVAAQGGVVFSQLELFGF